MLGRLVGEELERIWQGSDHDLKEVLCQNVPRGSASRTADDPAVTESYGAISQQAAVHPWLAADAHGNKQTKKQTES
jgi:hypothetical protein